MPKIPAVLDPVRVIRNEATASYRLAVERVYPNGKLAYAVGDDSAAPLVPRDYAKQLKALSLQQMLRAAALGCALLR